MATAHLCDFQKSSIHDESYLTRAQLIIFCCSYDILGLLDFEHNESALIESK